MTKRSTTNNKKLHRKLDMKQYEAHKQPRLNSGTPEGNAAPVPLLAQSCYYKQTNHT